MSSIQGNEIKPADRQSLLDAIERKKKENCDLQHLKSPEGMRKVRINNLVINAYQRLIANMKHESANS